MRYPLAVTSRDAVRTASGKAVAEITLDGVVSGQLGPEDVAVASETLRLQADFAEAGGKDPSRIDELLSKAPDVVRVLLN